MAWWRGGKRVGESKVGDDFGGQLARNNGDDDHYDIEIYLE